MSLISKLLLPLQWDLDTQARRLSTLIFTPLWPIYSKGNGFIQQTAIHGLDARRLRAVERAVSLLAYKECLIFLKGMHGIFCKSCSVCVLGREFSFSRVFEQMINLLARNSNVLENDL